MIIKQKKGRWCGPVALMNAHKLQGHRITPRHYKEYERKTGYNKLLKRGRHLLLYQEIFDAGGRIYKRNSIKSMEKALDSGCSLLVVDFRKKSAHIYNVYRHTRTKFLCVNKDFIGEHWVSKTEFDRLLHDRTVEITIWKVPKLQRK